MRSTVLQLEQSSTDVDQASLADALHLLSQQSAGARLVQTRKLQDAQSPASVDDDGEEAQFHTLYHILHSNKRPARDRHRAYDFILEQIGAAHALPCELPDNPDELEP